MFLYITNSTKYANYMFTPFIRDLLYPWINRILFVPLQTTDVMSFHLSSFQAGVSSTVRTPPRCFNQITWLINAAIQRSEPFVSDGARAADRRNTATFQVFVLSWLTRAADACGAGCIGAPPAGRTLFEQDW